MALKLYQTLAVPFTPHVIDQTKESLGLTERHLHVLWLEQKFFKSLVTTQGEKIEVISCGIWNKEAGPDFLKAHLRIGQREYRGDVEIHLQDEGWYQHGHHQDPRYNQVILHLSYSPSRSSFPFNKENGQQAFSCYLEESLMISLPQFISLVDFDLYPSKQFASRGHCAEHLFDELPDTQIRTLLQSAAYWRLEKKLHYLEQNFSHRSLQFAGGVAMALGYQHNAKAFLDLFIYLIPYRDLPYQELLAIALGCCGFLEEGRKKSWESSVYYQQLQHVWWGKKTQIIHQASLKLDRIRPLHHPMRRLAYLAHLLQDGNLEQLWSLTVEVWEATIQTIPLKNKQLQEKLLEILPSYPDSYWDYHFTFESQAQRQPLPGMGKEIKMHLLLNTTLPLLYAGLKESKDVQKWGKFQHFYASLGMSETSKSRYLHHRFFDDQKSERFLLEAQMAQGAYQLHQDFCMHFEASCQGCPFVERYQTQKNDQS